MKRNCTFLFLTNVVFTQQSIIVNDEDAKIILQLSDNSISEKKEKLLNLDDLSGTIWIPDPLINNEHIFNGYLFLNNNIVVILNMSLDVKITTKSRFKHPYYFNGIIIKGTSKNPPVQGRSATSEVIQGG